MKTIILKSAFAFAVALGGAGSASAEPDVSVLGQRVEDDAMSVRVSYADLDLASADAHVQLASRVRGAVREVCAPLNEKARWVQHIECRSIAWNNAQPQMKQAFAGLDQATLGGTAGTAVAVITVSAPVQF